MFCQDTLLNLSQIQPQNSLDDQVRPEDTVWVAAAVCVRAGKPSLHSCLGSDRKILQWNRELKLGHKTTKTDYATAWKSMQ